MYTVSSSVFEPQLGSLILAYLYIYQPRVRCLIPASGLECFPIFHRSSCSKCIGEAAVTNYISCSNQRKSWQKCVLNACSSSNVIITSSRLSFPQAEISTRIIHSCLVKARKENGCWSMDPLQL